MLLLFRSSANEDRYRTDAARPIGFLPAEISLLVALSMSLMALCLIFSLRLILFAILAMHFAGSMLGILMSSSSTSSLYCREISLRLILLIKEISFNVLGAPTSLQAMYTAAAMDAGTDLP